MKKETRLIAFYLPQFHPIAENDKWWGKGFTEWTNVGKAKPLFKGHAQPMVPADLGYYDLRLSKVREDQAEMAKFAGIEGFAYWHYWFAGKRLLEKPFNEIVKSKTPDFPFCLAWANETWSGIWHGKPGEILIEQTYPGNDDFINHFYSILDALRDDRYIKVDDKPIFIIYKPLEIPNVNQFISLWNDLALKNGLKGFYFVGVTQKSSLETKQILNSGFNAVNVYRLAEAKRHVASLKNIFYLISEKYFKSKIGMSIWNYKDIIKNWLNEDDFKEEIIPSIFPKWDNSPRSGKRAVIIKNSTPKLFEEHLKEMIPTVTNKHNKLLFLKSWNEWAEGNYVEPDQIYGLEYINVLHKYFK